MRRFFCAPLLLLCLPACGVQVSPDYQGEPLATLHGRIVSERTDAVPDADVALLWPDYSRGGSSTFRTTAVRVPVETQLPARFTVTMFEPPPESAYFPPLQEIWGTRFSSATIALVKRGVDLDDAPLPLCCDGKVLAYLDNYLLTYAEGPGKVDPPPDSGAPSLTIAKGWTLVRNDVTHCADGFDQACIERRAAAGDSEAFAKERCAIKPLAITHPVGVPLDTELTLTVRNLPPPWMPPEYTVPCP